jgi:phage-related minor tail protein
MTERTPEEIKRDTDEVLEILDQLGDHIDKVKFDLRDVYGSTQFKSMDKNCVRVYGTIQKLLKSIEKLNKETEDYKETLTVIDSKVKEYNFHMRNAVKDWVPFFNN